MLVAEKAGCCHVKKPIAQNKGNYKKQISDYTSRAAIPLSKIPQLRERGGGIHRMKENILSNLFHNFLLKTLKRPSGRILKGDLIYIYFQAECAHHKT
jgi:hypothetical protein